MMMPMPYTLMAAAAAARFGSLKNTPLQMVAAITPVTRKSYCSMMEPTMLAIATLVIWVRLGASSWSANFSSLRARERRLAGLRRGLRSIPAPIDQPAGQNHIDLPRGEAMARPQRAAAIEHHVLAALQGAAQIVGTQDVVLLQTLIVGLVDKRQGQNAVIDQVLAMDARKALRQHHPQAQVSRRDGR